ncbi:MAG TPA: M23 family metallopeptidase [Corynebacterium sp.]|nr:M23 family metallopeptidase [Corynebacterium sp.]
MSAHTPKRRFALVAATAGAMSTAGMGGAAAATLSAEAETPAEITNVDYQLVNDAASLSSGGAPQILAISEHKPTLGLGEQLDKAVDYASEALASAQAEANLTAMSSQFAPDVSELTAQNIPDAQPAASQQNASVVRPAHGTFTSGYGPRWGTLHAGIDIANSIGTPIYSVMNGTVINSGPASGYGNWIRVQHDDGSMAVYGHMNALYVGVGERVSAGQHIASMGSEGHSTGPHLHFEIHPTGNGAVDPVPWFANHGIHF